MTIQQWLQAKTDQLTKAGIGTARLDCLILLEDCIGKDRTWILAHQEQKIDEASHLRLEAWIGQRLQHVPLAYIRGKTEFYGREFVINHDVLEPRPESETMIDLLKALLVSQDEPLLFDIGTGSGALAITAKLEIPAAHVTALDIDAKCLATTRQNCKKHAVDITLLEGNLASPLRSANSQAGVILANLPYVPDSYQINSAALMEPRIAIFGGKDGLDLYRELFKQIDEYNLAILAVLTESLPFQHDSLTDIAKRFGFNPDLEEDFIQVFNRR